MSFVCWEDSLEQLLVSGDFSDLKFACNGHEFKVHKVVVCMQSPVIRSAVEGTFKESSTNVINMDIFPVSTVRQLVEFLYKADYEVDRAEARAPIQDDLGPEASQNEAIEKGKEDNKLDSGDGPWQTGCSMEQPETLLRESVAVASLLQHIRLNSLGDYYSIPRLVELANEKVTACVKSSNKDKSWVSSLPCLVETALHSTSDGDLPNILAKATAENISALLESHQFVGRRLVTNFSLKIIEAIMSQHEGLRVGFKDSIAETDDLQEQLERLEQKCEKLEHCVDALRKGSCQKCSHSFGAYIDRDGLVCCSGCSSTQQ